MRIKTCARSSALTIPVALMVLLAGACSSSRLDRGPSGTPSAQASRSSTPTPAPSAPSGPSLGIARGWGPAEQVSDHRLDDPDIAVGSLIRVHGASALSVWVSPAGRFASQVESSSRDATGQWSPARVVGPAAPGHVYQTDAALGPHGTAAVAWTRPNRDASRTKVEVTQREGGVWSAPHELGEGAVGGVEIDRDGVLTVAWAAGPAAADPVGSVITVSRLVHGQWQASQAVARNGWAPDVAVNGHGDLALVWATEQGVGVTLRRRATGQWQPPTLIKGIGFPEDPHVAIDSRGRALVMWARSPVEDNYVRRHLAWARTRPDGTWSAARFLDERAHRTVVGDDLDLSMNSRGQAVAAWSSAADHDASGVAQFSFRTGWTAPQPLAHYANGPVVLMTTSGTAIVMLNTASPHDWYFREPRGDWTLGGGVTSGDPIGAFGEGQQMAALYRVGRTLMARFLVVPTRPG